MIGQDKFINQILSQVYHYIVWLSHDSEKVDSLIYQNGYFSWVLQP